MLSFIAFSLTRAWQGFWRNAVMSLAATATMVLMLLLLAGFWIIQTGLFAALAYTEQKVEVVADLKDTAVQADVDGLRIEILSNPEVAGVTRW
jgi:cell division protein FtsX